MPSIKLYGPRGGSSFRPHWMLAELGLEYEVMPLELSKGEHKTPEFLAINAAGQVPVMIYDGFVLPESTAIVHFLAEKNNPSFFGPNDPESHGTLVRWELFVLLNINPSLTSHALKAWGRPISDDELKKADETLARYLPAFEDWMKSRKFVMGDAFTVADIVTRSTFKYAEASKYDLSAYPAIMAWMTRCAERPAYIKASQE